MIMTWSQMMAAWPTVHRLLEDGVDSTNDDRFDRATRNIRLRPDSPDTVEYRLEREVLEQAPEPGPDFEEEFDPFEVHRQPLPLAEVLANLKWLHRDCNGTHVCEIPAQFASFDPEYFDLAQYLKLSRAYRAHQAAGVRNRASRNGGARSNSRQAGLPHPEDGYAWKMRSNRLIEQRERRHGAK